ncbi:uncharacterized protein LOC119829894 [Zerene cesonia]|uniref:uncharacterized protein LOC119829894 n=1 Tax=Zerene cesonia TaxID=33412 RepID=UPI0018E51593|nr:uncharacterized protein LOC119829894 [Zerene cesonia]
MVSLTISEPAVRSFIFYSSVLALKMMFMSYLTLKKRVGKNVYANDEDAKARKGTVKYNDPDVERVRRAHLNDLENIPAFWVLGALYLTTGPSAAIAVTLFRVFAVCRIIYTIVYAVKPVPPPARGIAFGISSLISMYMGAHIVLYYLPVRSFIFHASVLGLKMLSMSFLTAVQRFRKRVFANEEDAKILDNSVVTLTDPDVERVRRAHLNDLESIPLFWILGGLYLTTGPSAVLATALFRTYTVSRIVHTVVYAIIPLPQPARGIAFDISFLIKLYMGVHVISHYIISY